MKKILNNLKFTGAVIVFAAALVFSQTASASFQYFGGVLPYDVTTTHDIVTCTGMSNGSINPTGTNKVNDGANSQPYTITPAAGYDIQDVTDNATSQGAISSYTFTNVTTDHTICATFKPTGSHPPVVTLTANPTSGNVNTVHGYLTWSATNSPTSCTASGDWSGSKATSGNNVDQGVLTQVKTYTYTLVCTNGDGDSNPASATVTVNPVGTPVNGQCSATHYACTLGTSTSNVDGTNAYTWTCQGTGTGHNDDSCTEAKSGDKPDLQVDQIPPASPGVNKNLRYTAQTWNRGSAPTDKGFTDLFQVSSTDAATTTAGGGTITNLPPVSYPYTLSAGGSTIATYIQYTFNTVGPHAMRACADLPPYPNGVIDESNEGNNCGAWSDINVVAPDLTAGSVNPTTAPVNTATTLSSVITNGGQMDTPTGFTNLFQIDNDADHSTITATRTDTSPVVAANGGTNTSTVSYTFPTIGTWYVRACADNDTSFNGTITETNEGNNCSPSWTAVNITSSAQDGVCDNNSSNSCSIGNPINETSSTNNNITTYNWSCSGINGGNTSNQCTHSEGVNPLGVAASCGTTPTHYNCASGTDDLSSNTENSSSYTWTCTGENNGPDDQCTEAKSGKPDLTAGSVLPTTAPVNTATSFSVPIINQGTVNTGHSFYNFIQVASSSGGSGSITNLAAVSRPPLAVMSSDMGFSYTFISTGIHSMRACADKQSPGDAGQIDESNENNNCGAWTDITVTGNTPINGSCAPNHYECSVGAPANTGKGESSYTWICKGSNTGSDAQCSEDIKLNPTDGVAGSCASTHYQCGDGSTSFNRVDGTYTYSWTCPGTAPGPDASCSENKPDQAGNGPDLTATNVGPSEVTANQQTQLTADIVNSGNASTGGSFHNFFQINTQQDGTGSMVELGSVPNPMSTLAAGATSQAQSTAYMFGGIGTYYIRACADKLNAGDSGQITETDENNNCSLWAPINVTAGGCGEAGCPVLCGQDGQPPCVVGPTAGQCGSSPNTCTAGGVSGQSQDDSGYHWICNGLDGGSSATCSSSTGPGGGGTPATCNDGIDQLPYKWPDSQDPSCHSDCNAKHDGVISSPNTYEPTWTEGAKKCVNPIYQEH